MDSNVGPKTSDARCKEYRSRNRTASKKFQRLLEKKNVWDVQTPDSPPEKDKTRENA